MKRRYSYLRVLLIMVFFSMSSASCAGRPDDVVKEDFAFIMESLRASKYQEALQGNDERWGIQKFGEEDPIFTMRDNDGHTMLHAVIKAKEDVQGATTRINAIDEILKKCPDLLNAQDTFGHTPFMVAVYNNREKAIEYLLTKQTLDLTKKSYELDVNALSLAIRHNRPIALIKRMLDRNPDLLNGKDEQMRFLLHEACGIQITYDKPLDSQKQDEIDIISALIKWNPSLCCLQERNKVAIISELIKRKPDLLKEKDGKGRTPLQLPTKGLPVFHQIVTYLDDCKGTIDVILEHNPGLLNAQDDSGYTPFMIAVIDDKEEAIECLLTKRELDLTKKSYDYDFSALSLAIRHNRPVALIKQMLDKNPELLNEHVGKDEWMRSLLHEAFYAIMMGNEPCDPQEQNKVAIISELIKRKPELLKEKDGQGRTPLQLTTNGWMVLHSVVTYLDDCEEIIKVILEHKSDLLNAQDDDGFTPFMLAVVNNREKAIECLLAKPTLDLTKKDHKSGLNALAWAIYRNRPLTLIKRMLDINPDLLNEHVGKDEQVESLLHVAIEMGIKNEGSLDVQQKNREAIINELIKRKPNFLKERNGEGQTPLEYAKELKSKGELIDETLITTLETAEKELPSQPQFLDTTHTADDTNAPWYYNKAIIGLIGIPVILGIAYRIKKMFDAKNKPVSEHVEDETTTAAHADW